MFLQLKLLKNSDVVENLKIKKGKNFKIIFAGIFLLFFSGHCFFACGKKGPPVPPEHLPPCNIFNLKTKVIDNKLELSWSVKTERGCSEPVGFRVYKAKNLISEADCPKCPQFFKKVADIPATDGFLSLKKNKRIYYETLESGFIYRYKVTAYSRVGIPGKESDIVEVMAR